MLRRKLSQWKNCCPKAMAEMSSAAIQFAFEDAKHDILALATLLCQAGYPRRGTPEQAQDINEFAEKVQTLISHKDAIELKF